MPLISRQLASFPRRGRSSLAHRATTPPGSSAGNPIAGAVLWLALAGIAAARGGLVERGLQAAELEQHAAAVCFCSAAAPAAESPDGQSDGVSQPLVIEEPPAVLEAVHPRTEADWDHLEALARFSAGRVLERKGKLAEALRHYQRAWRYDPKAVAAAESAVRLALTLERRDEAARIVLATTSDGAFTATQLMEVAVHLSRQGRWEEATGVFERLLARRKDKEPTLGDVALRLELGRLEFLLGHGKKAAEQFAFVAQAFRDPEKFGFDRQEQKRLVKNPAAAWRLFGKCFLEAGRIEEARNAFQKAHQLDPNRGLLGYDLATVALKTNQPEQALEELEHYFQAHATKEKSAPYVLLAEILEKLDRKDELLDRLESLHKEDPENVALGYYLAQRYVLAEKYDQAEPLYRQLLEKQPAADGYRGLARLLYRKHRLADMLALLGQMIEKDVPLQILEADVDGPWKDSQWVSQLVAEARKQLQSGDKAFTPSVAAAALLLAVEAEQLDAAEQFLAQARKMKEKPQLMRQLWLELASSLLSEEHYSKAAQLLQEGLEQGVVPNDNPLGYSYLAGALEMAGQTDKALQAAHKAVKLGDEAPRYLSRLGWVLYHAGRNEQAREVYLKLVERHDNDFTSAQVRRVVRDAKLVLSNLAVEENHLEEAEKWLEEVLDEFPNDVSALNDLGYLWADRSTRLQRAHRMIRQAVEADPENAAYRDSLGWVLYRLGQLEEAAKELEKAAAARSDPVILDHLGDVQHALGRIEQAKQSWKKAVEAFEKESQKEQADRVREKLRKDHPPK